MFCALAFSEVKAQSVPITLTADSAHQHIKTTLTEWGVGGVSLLDTYLSPLTYKGTDFAFDYHTERLAHWGKRHVTVSGQYGGHYAYAQRPSYRKSTPPRAGCQSSPLWNSFPALLWYAESKVLYAVLVFFYYNIREFTTERPHVLMAAESRLGGDSALSFPCVEQQGGEGGEAHFHRRLEKIVYHVATFSREQPLHVRPYGAFYIA